MNNEIVFPSSYNQFYEYYAFSSHHRPIPGTDKEGLISRPFVHKPSKSVVNTRYKVGEK